ncbi:MAG: hypothetical protein ACI9S7_001379, partial [Candidatus Paceibacteria bacterium]
QAIKSPLMLWKATPLYLQLFNLPSKWLRIQNSS